jgi:hypothetical protein
MDSRRDAEARPEEEAAPRSRGGKKAGPSASANNSHITMPDLKQMVPYKAEQIGGVGPVGMAVALSPVLSAFMTSLPLPHMWDGPLVGTHSRRYSGHIISFCNLFLDADTERLLQIIRDAPLERNPPPNVTQGAPGAPGRGTDGRKGKGAKNGGEESDGEDEDGNERAGPGVKRGGSGDIYKQRMMKKIKLQQTGQ